VVYPLSVLQGGVPLPVCVVEGRPSTCLCCRRVSSCLSVLLGCVPLPVRGPPELQSGMFLFWVLHSFFTPFLFTPWHCLGPLQTPPVDFFPWFFSYLCHHVNFHFAFFFFSCPSLVHPAANSSQDLLSWPPPSLPTLCGPGSFSTPQG
jgi:hypothetical protein